MKCITQQTTIILLLSCSLIAAQQCSNGDFIVANGQDTLLKITSANEVFTCDRVNICEKINDGLQTLSLSSDGTTLSVSNGNSVTLADPSPTNELQTLTLGSDGAISISNGNAIVLPDSSATNELQRLSISSSTLAISGGNSVELPDASATNELQTLTIDKSQFSLSNGGGSVDISGMKTYLKFLGFSVSVPTGTVKAGGVTVLPFSDVNWITFPHDSYNNVTYSFNPPLNGYYRMTIRGFSPTSTATTDSRIQLYWKINSSPTYHGICGSQLSSGDSPFSSCSYIVKLSVTDTVYAQMYSPITISLGSSSGTEFQWQTEFLGPE